MEEWFGGRESKLGEFLNPDKEGSTFHQFRKDIFEKIAAISAQVSEQKGMKVAQKKGTQKGLNLRVELYKSMPKYLLQLVIQSKEQEHKMEVK